MFWIEMRFYLNLSVGLQQSVSPVASAIRHSRLPVLVRPAHRVCKRSIAARRDGIAAALLPRLAKRESKARGFRAVRKS